MMLACVCPSQIIVEILHNLAAAASPAEPALKSEMLALLGDEAETNACWAQLRIAKGENDPPLLPNGLGDIRKALDDSQQGDSYRNMYERLKRRADAVHQRLDALDEKKLKADRLLCILLRVLARKPVRRLFIYELWTRMWCAPSHPPPHTVLHTATFPNSACHPFSLQWQDPTRGGQGGGPGDRRDARQSRAGGGRAWQVARTSDDDRKRVQTGHGGVWQRAHSPLRD
jgi:hypothetical protein